MKKKAIMKRMLAVGLAGAMVLSIAACGGAGSKDTGKVEGNTDSTEEDSKDGITLEFQQWWGVELPEGALQEICDDFTKDTGIKIKLLSNPYADTKTQIAAGAVAGTMADVVGLDGSWVYDFAQQGSIANLTELMEKSGYDTSQLSDQVKAEGNTYMIPVVNFAYPLYVNMDILEEAGVSAMPTNWSEFMDALDKVTKNTDAAGICIPLSTEAPNGIQNQFMSWLWASGGTMLKDGKPALKDNENLSKVVDFVKEMKDKGYLSDGVEAMKEQDMVNEFENGRLAFMVDGISHLTTIKKESPDLNFDCTKMPVMDGFTGESGMDVANWGIGIASNCENKEEAMQFVEYLMSPEVNAELAQLANAFPGNNTAKPDYSANDELFKKAYEIFQSGYATNEFTGLPTSEDLMRSFNEQLVLYLDGDTATVEDMLSTIQGIWELAFE